MQEVIGLQNVRLGDVLDIRDGTHGTPKYVEHGIPLITSKNLTDSGLSFREINFISENDHNEISKRSAVDKGDILYGMIGTIGKPTLVETDRKFSIKNVALFKQSNPGIYNRYLLWLLNSPAINKQIAHASKGGTQKFVSLGALRGLKATFPSFYDQQRIAAILDQADALRAKRRKALAQLDSLAQSIFIEMFGDPETNTKGLEITKLSVLCKRVTDGTHQSPTWSAVGHPFLFVSNIVSGEIDFDTKKFISEETYDELTRRCPIEVGDVLYSTVGSYGVPVVVRTSRKFAFQRHIAHIKPNSDLLDSEFLCAMLDSPPLRKQADRVARGVAQKTVNLSDIGNFLVFKPPLKLQQEFANRAAMVARLKAAHLASFAELDALFASLQHRAFRGEL